MTDSRPSFLNAYLVTDGTDVAGVVRRKGHIWRVMLFGIPANEQPIDEFERREAAGEHLLYLARQRKK